MISFKIFFFPIQPCWPLMTSQATLFKKHREKTKDKKNNYNTQTFLLGFQLGNLEGNSFRAVLLKYGWQRYP